jgi:hypothetical protein
MGGCLPFLPPRMSHAAAVGTEFPTRGESLATAFGGGARTEPKPVRTSLIAASPELSVSGDRLGGLMLQRVLEHVGDDRQLENFRSVRALQDGLPHRRRPPKERGSVGKQRLGGAMHRSKVERLKRRAVDKGLIGDD